ncbi:Dienelactone hydrolase [Pseudomonas sp. 8AS]|uniref:dienelactone hydrolase family protein n=1 Tax=Pseudomonas sp. 8AS TaxID=2653163 RepID=UPI0012F3E114|nr:alpha/beta family hydrolase [Pseudomonas sp. 8AS]VXC21839.1 Dienelactone hydrolase [Pseudomonas sp. 8AS]
MTQRTLQLQLPDVRLGADLLLPEGAPGLVLFVHGSGSSRRSPRNRQVAREFAARGLATLLFDLLSEAEQRIDQVTCELRFDIALLERRILGVIDWLDRDAELAPLRLGLFGASTGAAAALRAAAERPQRICAVVSRGGRSDLAGAALARVQAPTLQIVGSADPAVWRLNREASRQLPGEQQLQVIPGASHLFEEPGAMEEVARLAGDWFLRYLGTA